MLLHSQFALWADVVCSFFCGDTLVRCVVCQCAGLLPVGNPRFPIDVLEWRLGEIGLHVRLFEQEAVDECLDEWIFGLWQLAVSVSARYAVTHAVFDAECAPHFLGCVDRHISALVGQPLIVGITEVEQGTRAYQCCQFVVVDWHACYLLVSIVGLYVGKEPCVVGVEAAFHIAQRLAVSPRCNTAAAWLLWYDEADALVECTAIECTLACP